MDKYSVGQKLIVVLHSTQEVLDAEYVGGTKTRIDLTDIRDHYTGMKKGYMLSFYQPEIESISLLSEAGIVPEQPIQKETKEETSKNYIRVPKTEYERLKEMPLNATYLVNADKIYFEATKYLFSCENVGLAAIGSENGRQKQLNLLVLCSWDQAYIFDMQINTKKFMPEIKAILESKAVKKIVHGSHTLVDCLFHCHEIKLENYFDTQVADLMLSKRDGNLLKETRTLSECFHHYLNFPRSLLEPPVKVNPESWRKRPLKDYLKINAAQLGSYLITLKSHLENLLLKDYYTAVDLYSNNLKQMDSYEASQNDNSKVPDVLNDFLKKRTTKKWKSLRNCFARELAKRKSKKSGSAATWKTYIYFDQMSFLMRRATNKETTASMTAVDEDLESDGATADNIPPSTDHPPLRKNKKACIRSKDQNAEVLEVIKGSLQQREMNERRLNEDDDRNFLLSLLDDLKKVNEQRKMDVKMEMMQAIRKALVPTQINPLYYHAPSGFPSSPTLNYPIFPTTSQLHQPTPIHAAQSHFQDFSFQTPPMANNRKI